MSILGNRILGGAGQQPYLVGRSLRFRSSASAYLNRTNASNGNLNTWTISFWIKRGALTTGSNQCVIGTSYTSLSEIVIRFNADDTFRFEQYASGGTTNLGTLVTSQVFRDPSAWYHFVIIFDSSNATASNRVRLYVNGTQVTAFSSATYPAQNANSIWNNNANTQFIGKYSTAQHFDGYLAEVNFIDGQALTPSSFGAYDNNGVWQPRKYGGTYGTNGFYLPFSNTTSTTTLVQDSSGNGNNWTPNNISLTAGTTYDSMIDSPTVSASSSNYAVLNPLIPANSGFTNTFSEANQNGTITGTGGSAIFSSITMSSGSWYWETYVVNVGGGTNIDIGICSTAYPPSTMSNANGAIGGKAGGYSIFNLSGASYKANNNVATAYGVTYTNGDTIMTAFDATNGKIWFGKNGTWMASGDPATAANPTFSSIPSDTYWAGFGCAGGVSRTVQAVMNFGQRPFSYTPPTGFNALNTQNLPQPTIMNGAKYMQATLYTGNGSSTQTIAQSVTGNSATFLPDFVWTKGRSGATNNIQIDTVRGGANYLISDSTSAEVYNAAAAIQSFSSNGYVIGNGGAVNTNAATYVSWQWNAGSGTTSTNTNGTISSLVSVNASAGFSIVSYVGNATAGSTVGHGLGVAPSFIIIKNRTDASNWAIYHVSVGSTKALLFDTSTGSTLTAYWNDTSPTSSVYTVGTANITNGSSKSMIAYCWSAVAGYSAFGSYTGNGSSDGPFVYTGFRPRWVMIKNITTGGVNYDWVLIDSSREPYNVTQNDLAANTSASEASGILSQPNDFLSNGFKIRASGVNAYPTNASGSTYIYAAFAENPFKVSRAR